MKDFYIVLGVSSHRTSGPRGAEILVVASPQCASSEITDDLSHCLGCLLISLSFGLWPSPDLSREEVLSDLFH